MDCKFCKNLIEDCSCQFCEQCDKPMCDNPSCSYKKTHDKTLDTCHGHAEVKKECEHCGGKGFTNGDRCNCWYRSSEHSVHPCESCLYDGNGNPEKFVPTPPLPSDKGEWEKEFNCSFHRLSFYSVGVSMMNPPEAGEQMRAFIRTVAAKSESEGYERGKKEAVKRLRTALKSVPSSPDPDNKDDVCAWCFLVLLEAFDAATHQLDSVKKESPGVKRGVKGSDI